MSTSDNVNQGIKIGIYEESEQLSSDLSKHLKGKITFLCIGTDRSTGDSFGPIIGTMLEKKGYENVIGTIDCPCHGVNLDERIKEIPDETTVLAIDASLGGSSKVGKLTFNRGELMPGKALNKDLTAVGDFHLTGIVNTSGYMEFEMLQSTRLSQVIKMVEKVVKAIEVSCPINKFNSLKNVN